MQLHSTFHFMLLCFYVISQNKILIIINIFNIIYIIIWLFFCNYSTFILCFSFLFCNCFMFLCMLFCDLFIVFMFFCVQEIRSMMLFVVLFKWDIIIIRMFVLLKIGLVPCEKWFNKLLKALTFYLLITFLGPYKTLSFYISLMLMHKILWVFVVLRGLMCLHKIINYFDKNDVFLYRRNISSIEMLIVCVFEKTYNLLKNNFILMNIFMRFVAFTLLLEWTFNRLKWLVLLFWSDIIHNKMIGVHFLCCLLIFLKRMHALSTYLKECLECICLYFKSSSLHCMFWWHTLFLGT